MFYVEKFSFDTGFVLESNKKFQVFLFGVKCVEDGEERILMEGTKINYS